MAWESRTLLGLAEVTAVVATEADLIPADQILKDLAGSSDRKAEQRWGAGIAGGSRKCGWEGADCAPCKRYRFEGFRRTAPEEIGLVQSV